MTSTTIPALDTRHVRLLPALSLALLWTAQMLYPMQFRSLLVEGTYSSAAVFPPPEADGFSRWS
jgi:hypothetical protein